MGVGEKDLSGPAVVGPAAVKLVHPDLEVTATPVSTDRDLGVTAGKFVVPGQLVVDLAGEALLLLVIKLVVE